MNNITDYIRWYQQFSFAEVPFSEVDNLVFCQMAYYGFEIGKAVREGMLANGQDDGFLDAVVSSRRFGDLVVCVYEDVFDPDTSTQFAAVTFQIGENTRFVAFRGTDPSLVGWKEDFMISYTKTSAQELAAAYLNRQLGGDGKFYVGGHSKGGNLALYACCHADMDKLVKVQRIFINDGPGLCPEVSDLSLLDRIRDKTTLIFPEFSVFGKLFTPDIPDQIIVKSSYEGLYQHDLLSWGVEHGHLLVSDRFDPGSAWINGVFDQWIESVDTQSRQQFVDDFFAALAVNGAKTRHEVAHGMVEVERVLHNLLESGAQTKKTAAKLPLTAIFGNFFQQVKSLGIVQAIMSSQGLQGLLFLVLGLSLIALPDQMFSALVIVLLAAVVVLQLGLTVRALILSKWDFQKERIRVTISIVLAALFSVILVKPQALFIVGSFIGGVWLLVLALQAVFRAKDNKGKENFLFWKSVSEAAMFAICGAFMLVAPEETFRWFILSLGAIMVLDGLATAIYSFMRGSKHG